MSKLRVLFSRKFNIQDMYKYMKAGYIFESEDKTKGCWYIGFNGNDFIGLGAYFEPVCLVDILKLDENYNRNIYNIPNDKNITIVGSEKLDDKITTPIIDDKKTIINKEKGMLENIKDYLKSHKDILFTIVVLVIVDKLVFKGAFSEKAKNLINKLTDKVTN